MDEPVVVVGAGIAGAACARVLAAAGIAVELVDRGRVVGGRMASRRHEGRPVDIGASYFTVSDPAFEAVVRTWATDGLAHEWTDTFGVVDPEGRSTTTGPVRWGTPRGIRSLVEAHVGDLSVKGMTHVEGISSVGGRPTVDGRPARAVVLAMPDPQARAIVDPVAHPGVVQGLTTDYEAVLALTAVYPERCWDELPDGLFVNDDPVLTWIADDGRRRGDGAGVLVAHSADVHARAHLAVPPAGGPSMLEAMTRLVGPTLEPVHTRVQRWTFGKPRHGRRERFLLTDTGVAACGDSWSKRPRVEGAWLSGTALGEALVERLA